MTDPAVNEAGVVHISPRVASVYQGLSEQLAGDPLFDFLDSIAGSAVDFYPKSGNAGDGYISHCTYRLFQRFGINATARRQEEPSSSPIVIIGGGGNLIEGRYNDVAKLIERHRDAEQLVLLPHSIVGYRDTLAETHRNLKIFCRERVSYDLALANGANPRATYLSHDMAFFGGGALIADYAGHGSGLLTALRTDGESRGTEALPPDNTDISLSWNGDLWTDPEFAELATRALAAFISRYETVTTDRLHVSILAGLLGKTVYLLPNAYFKNRAVFEHSMRDRLPNVTFIDTLSRYDAASLGSSAPDPLGEEATLREALFDATAEIWTYSSQLTTAEERLEIETQRRETAERRLQVQLAENKTLLRRALKGEQSAAVARTDLENITAERTDFGAQYHSTRSEQGDLRTNQVELSSAYEQLITTADKLDHTLLHVAALKAESDSLRDQLRVKQVELSSAYEQLIAAADKLDRTLPYVAALKDEVEFRKKELDAVLQSTSWKVTEPLRWLSRLVVRRGG